MPQTQRPRLVEPRAVQTLEAVRTVTGGAFDADAWHVMDRRDDVLIAEEILHGPGSSAFVYSYKIAGQDIVGVSSTGARQLAHHYRGLKHRIVASMEKIGPLFTFVSYPGEHQAMSVSCNVVPELADEADFYSSVVEVTDIKTGNSVQMEKREARVEFRRDGSSYERPHYAQIAQSKAYRNAVLALVPQDVVIAWRDAMLKLQKGETITAGVLAEKRAGVVRFAARHGVTLERRSLEAMTLDQIAGLGDAARDGLPAFTEAAKALNLSVDVEASQTSQAAPPPPAPSTGSGEAPDEQKREGLPDPPASPPSSPPPTSSPPGSSVEGEPTTRRGRRVNFEGT